MSFCELDAAYNIFVLHFVSLLFLTCLLFTLTVLLQTMFV